MEDRPGASRSRCVVIGLCLLGLVLAALAAGVAFLHRVFPLTPEYVSPATLPDVEREARVRLPPSVRMLEGELRENHDTLLIAKLTIDPGDVDALLRAVQRKGAPHVGGWRSTTSTGGIEDLWGARAPRWWTPGSARRFVAAGSEPNYRLLVDLDDPQHPVAYLAWSSW